MITECFTNDIIYVGIDCSLQKCCTKFFYLSDRGSYHHMVTDGKEFSSIDASDYRKFFTTSQNEIEEPSARNFTANKLNMEKLKQDCFRTY